MKICIRYFEFSNISGIFPKLIKKQILVQENVSDLRRRRQSQQKFLLKRFLKKKIGWRKKIRKRFSSNFWKPKKKTKWRPKNSKKNKKIKQTQFFFKNEISDFYSFGVRKGFKGSLCIHLLPSCLGSNLSTFKRETASLYIQAVAISKMSSARNANLRF